MTEDLQKGVERPTSELHRSWGAHLHLDKESE